MKKITLKKSSDKITMFHLLKKGLYRMLLVSVMYVFALVSTVQAQSFTVNVDFGSDNTPSEGWNNITLETMNIQALLNSNGAATDISLSVYDAFNGVNNSGSTGTEGIPTLASSDSFFGNTAVFESASEPTGGVKFSGLDPDKSYNLVILSSRAGATDNRETKFDIIGASSDVLTVNSSSNTTTVSGSYSPDANGVLTIDVSAGPNNDNSYKFYYLNTIQLSYELATALTDVEEEQPEFDIYPNPVKDYMNVKATELSEMKIFDVSGNVVHHETIEEGNNKINIDLKAGLYFIQMFVSDKAVYSNKFIVE